MLIYIYIKILRYICLHYTPGFSIILLQSGLESNGEDFEIYFDKNG